MRISNGDRDTLAQEARAWGTASSQLLGPVALGSGGTGGFERMLADAARDPRRMLEEARTAGETRPGVEVGRQFEELLATQLVREMRRSLTDGFFGSGAGSDTYDSWMEEHLGRALARGGDFGIADTVQRQLDARAAHEARVAAEAAQGAQSE